MPEVRQSMTSDVSTLRSPNLLSREERTGFDSMNTSDTGPRSWQSARAVFRIVLGRFSWRRRRQPRPPGP